MKNENLKKKVYLIVFDPKAESKFKIVPIEFRQLSYKHPLLKKTGAIFADEEYAKQFYNFVVTNAKKQDEEREKIAVENVRQHLEAEANKPTIEQIKELL